MRRVRWCASRRQQTVEDDAEVSRKLASEHKLLLRLKGDDRQQPQEAVFARKRDRGHQGSLATEAIGDAQGWCRKGRLKGKRKGGAKGGTHRGAPPSKLSASNGASAAFAFSASAQNSRAASVSTTELRGRGKGWREGGRGWRE